MQLPIRIVTDNPLDPQVRQMIAESDEYYSDLYPAESNHLFDPVSLCAPNISFYAARRGEDIVGFGAVVAMDGYGEIKRMFVDPKARGEGVGRRLLEEIERRAVALGLPVLRLETGVRQPEAISLYRTHGFHEIAPFGDYKIDPLSLFMEKNLPTQMAIS
ncbi:GNAT family N-acetyltransferase [Bradyrhizobium sp. CB82]|uniref:GNAT family N-acetyltransferase n=1 Tax=Bradyrhizobium sp. CB82 TaxID=3039159 RepID=UPI0024B12200|nr:GNAT family N-acetyltransferase [Bradyrhizobium sp. CB82]WFU42032.1 GNAT family N-acetyltransferase [Bradyrhizobium sp. CB82]